MKIKEVMEKINFILEVKMINSNVDYQELP